MEPPSAETAKPLARRRWPRLRFSLRTLVLFVLLVGSGATLWWNWEPWVLERTVSADSGDDLTVELSPTGKFLYTFGHEPVNPFEIQSADTQPPTTVPESRIHKLWETATGEILLRFEPGVWIVGFSDDEQRIVVKTDNSVLGRGPGLELWNLTSRKLESKIPASGVYSASDLPPEI